MSMGSAGGNSRRSPVGGCRGCRAVVCAAAVWSGDRGASATVHDVRAYRQRGGGSFGGSGDYFGDDRRASGHSSALARGGAHRCCGDLRWIGGGSGKVFCRLTGSCIAVGRGPGGSSGHGALLGGDTLGRLDGVAPGACEATRHGTAWRRDSAPRTSVGTSGAGPYAASRVPFA